MTLSKDLESVFRKKYSTCVVNFNIELFEYLDLVIEEMRKRGDLESFTTEEQFERFAIDAMLWKAQKLSSDYKGKYDALHLAMDLLENQDQ